MLQLVRDSRAGLLVQRREGGSWSTVRRVVPRRLAEPVAAEALAGEDAERAAISNGQAVTAVFATPEPVQGLMRSWFMGAAASFEGSGAGSFSRRGAEEAASTLRFALHQNQPNPFSRQTSIAFDLPRAETVSLDVYDATGRRVRTLASGWRPAGPHRVDWDQRDRTGGLVRPGVYLYRLRTAGSGVIERKLVVLP